MALCAALAALQRTLTAQTSLAHSARAAQDWRCCAQIALSVKMTYYARGSFEESRSVSWASVVPSVIQIRMTHQITHDPSDLQRPSRSATLHHMTSFAAGSQRRTATTLRDAAVGAAVLRRQRARIRWPRAARCCC
jgi:hypothetical protein